MGNYADGADTVSIDFVKEICPEEMENFQAALDRADVSFDEFSDLKSGLDTDTKSQENIDNLYELLKKKFDKTTGLTLGLVHHKADDRGDELDGGSFVVEGVWQLTSAGEKYISRIEKKTWTNFG